MKKTVNIFIQESIAKHFLSHDPTWQRMLSCRASPTPSYPHTFKKLKSHKTLLLK
jgi:hypothetical protein